MIERPDSDFCITIDYEKGFGSPSRVFRAMSDLIDALQETDRNLIRSIDGKLEPLLLLEDVDKNGEYVRGNSHVNTCESIHALLKRGIIGTFHHISKQHLHRYLSEFDFRFNARKSCDGERTLQAIQGFEGKRLMYKTSNQKGA